MAKAGNFEYWDEDVKREGDRPSFEPHNDPGMSLGFEFLNLCQICEFVKDSVGPSVSASQAAYLEDCLKSALKAMEEVEHEVVFGDEAKGQVVLFKKAEARKLLYSTLACRDSLTSPSPTSLSTVRDPPVKHELPKISLPKFNGDFSQWRNFWGLFHALVDSRVELSNVVKFHYLLQSLIDEPNELVKGLQVTADNYQIAISLLRQRYENDDKNRQILIHKFTNLPNPKHTLTELSNL